MGREANGYPSFVSGDEMANSVTVASRVGLLVALAAIGIGCASTAHVRARSGMVAICDPVVAIHPDSTIGRWRDGPFEDWKKIGPRGLAMDVVGVDEVLADELRSLGSQAIELGRTAAETQCDFIVVPAIVAAKLRNVGTDYLRRASVTATVRWIGIENPSGRGRFEIENVCAAEGGSARKAWMEALRVGLRSMLADGRIGEHWLSTAPTAQDEAAIEAADQPAGDWLLEARRSVFTLLNYRDHGHGSGFAFANGGWGFSNVHVFGRSSALFATVDGTDQRAALAWRRNRERDVVLFRFSGDPVASLPVASTPPEIGADVFVIGSPLEWNAAGSVAKGVVSNRAMREGQEFMQTDAPVNPETAGAPSSTNMDRLWASSWKKSLGLPSKELVTQSRLRTRWSQWTGLTDSLC